MYPDLSYLLHDIFGTDVDNWTSIFKTFGLLLATAFLACAWFLKSELKRKEEEGLLQATTKTIITKAGVAWKEVIYNAIVFGLIGLKIPYIVNNFPAFQQNPASILFSSKGNWLIGIIAFLAVAGYTYFVQKKENTEAGEKTIVIRPHERTGDIIITAAISGVLGSKLFSISENIGAFFQDPLGQLISGNGLNIYGGVILGAIAVYYYVSKNNIKPIHMLDIGGPGILLGYAVGRMGCQLSGDGDWGILAAAQPEWWFFPDWLWSYNFPNNVNNAGVLLDGCDSNVFNAAAGSVEQRCQQACGIRYCHELEQGVYPTSIYEIVISLLGFGLMWIWRKKIRIGGMLFAVYLIYNGIERFFIESIRVNEKYELFGLNWSQAQYISIVFILLGILGIFYLLKYGKHYDPVTA